VLSHSDACVRRGCVDRGCIEFSRAVAGVWWLRECERSFLEILSVKLRREAFARREPMTGSDELVMLTAGMASRGGAFLSAGATWGDVILTSHALRDTTSVVALSYCEAAKLSRSDLFEVLHHFPTSAKSIQEAALHLAIQRAMMIISVYARKHLKGSGGYSRGTTTDPADEVTVEQLKQPHKLLQHVMVDGLRVESWREIVDGTDGSRRCIATSSKQGQSNEPEQAHELLSDLADAPPSQQLSLVAQLVVEKQKKTDRVLATIDEKMASMASGMDEKLSAMALTMNEKVAKIALSMDEKISAMTLTMNEKVSAMALSVDEKTKISTMALNMDKLLAKTGTPGPDSAFSA
jgi:hypothetical protein